MKLWILGSGVAVPNMLRAPSSYLLEGRDGRRILLDAGACVLLRLEQAGIDFRTVESVYLSHFHPDHCAGLVPLLFAHYVPDGRSRRRLRIVGAAGTAHLYDSLRRAWGDWMAPKSLEIEISEVRGHAFEDGSFEVTVGLGPHTESSLAFRISEKGGGTLVYSGDTPGGESLVNLARGADLLLLECSFPAGMRVSGHLSADEAGRIAAAAGVRRLVLTHFYPECASADVRSQAAEHFKGEITLAQDLARIEI